MRMRQRSVWSSLLALVLLAGCSKEDKDLLPPGQQSVTLTAWMEGQTTAKVGSRVTSDNRWTAGQLVSVQIAGEVKRYSVKNAASGMLVAATGVTPWYWKSVTDSKTVTAWFPDSDSQPTSFTVKADQNFGTGLGYQQSDMICAAATIRYGSPTLLFHHLPAKVVVNLKAGKGVTEEEVQAVTVSIEGQPLTSGAIDPTHWSVAQVASGNNTIVPKVLATPSAGSHKTVQALLVPQLTTSAARFIRITIGGQEFVYSTALNLVAGTQYPYTITVSRNGINVTASGGQAWTGSDIPVTSEEVTIFSASDLKIGDYYYSDGTWSDGGLRKLYADGTFAKEDIAPVLIDTEGDSAKKVLGIVFKVGREGDGSDWKDDCTYYQKDGSTQMNTIHGYVLGLHDTKDESGNIITPQWGSYGTKVEHNDMNRERNTGFYGYKNTNAIKAFATQNGWTLQSAFPPTYHATAGYEARSPAPTNSSGWFLPSAGQGRYWLNNRDVILASVRKATGDNSYNWQDYYWSSSEVDDLPALGAWGVSFGDGNVASVSKGNGFNVRSIFAF